VLAAALAWTWTPPPAAAWEEPAPNAALKYWQAFALAPGLNEAQEALVTEWEKSPLDAPTLALAASAENARRQLLRGAKIRACDWENDYEDGLNMLLPHLAKGLSLARLAALHGRVELSQGRPEAAADDVVAILTLARHVGVDPIAVSIMVRHAIESTGVDLAAAHLPELREQAPRILAALDAPPPGATFHDAYLAMERRSIRWLAAQLREAEAREPGSWRKVWKQATGRPDGPAAVERVESLEAALKLTEDLAPLCDELAAMAELPPKEFDARYPAFRQQAKKDYPLAGYILSGPDAVLPVERRSRARAAMLKAAVAVVAGGPARLADVPDPFGDGPFESVPVDGGGFELRSKLLDRGKPVSLTVGRPPR